MDTEIQIEVDEIQGDVLVGLQKQQQAFLSFEIVDVAAFKQFLIFLAPRITSLRVTLEREFILASRKDQGENGILTLIGIVIGFTADGLSRLGVPDIDRIKDEAFKQGLAARAGTLNDPAEGDGAPTNWLVGAPGQPLHGLLMVTGPRLPPGSSVTDPVQKQVDLIHALAGAAWRILREDLGQVRLDARGHEHFGFQDGISQPGVRGQIDASFLGRPFLTPRLNPDDPGQGVPGQDLIWPGAFVFGYPGQSADGDAPTPTVGDGPSWMRNGSFMVYRRLRQLVPEFEAEVRARAATLDMDSELLAARLIGRWKSGAPLVTIPLGDDPALGADAMANNDFEFSQDRDGRRCPFAAHIRKSYPRDDITPAANPTDPEAKRRAVSSANTLTHRIIRAGIPYGGKVSLDEAAALQSSEDRGLMFVCYQTSITDQFEFILQKWVNNPGFPTAGAGHDPILGQANGDRARRFAGGFPSFPAGPGGPEIALARDFIIPTGGGYFFMPSLTALTETLAAADDPARPAAVGRWDPVMAMPNVPVHSHLLPDGNVLFWGRREKPNGGMDEHACTPHVWDRSSAVTLSTPPVFRATPQPKMPNDDTVNLFCSGHTMLPDGKLFVAGGHLKDQFGVNQACIYDWQTDRWTALPPMNHGRWYPAVTILPDGAVLVTSGSFFDGSDIINNATPQIWDGVNWHSLDQRILSLYPRMVVTPAGHVFAAGTDAPGADLDLAAGTWAAAPGRLGGDRQYAPAVLYAPGRVLFTGGGNDPVTKIPTAAAELIDLAATHLAWQSAAPMAFPRRQHNATLLPDGTVLVTGGTRGGGGLDDGFNDLTDGAPVLTPELWDPVTDAWTRLAPETNERCYHSTALLLPDGTVLSAGGGEYKPNNTDLPPQHVHRDGQVFHPPYLFRGDQPRIKRAPDEIAYGAKFTATCTGPQVARVTLLRLGSVTHSLDCNQRFLELAVDVAGDTLHITAPDKAAICPPGWYMLFALSAQGVPSHAHILRVGPPAQPGHAGTLARTVAAEPTVADRFVSPTDAAEIVVGLTSRCPYGLASCWGGAYHSLGTLDGVRAVDPVADKQDSTASLFVAPGTVPDTAAWTAAFTQVANGSYDVRGFETTLEGTWHHDGTDLLLALDDGRVVGLRPVGALTLVAWDWAKLAPRDPAPDELTAFDRLRTAPAGRVRVTGAFQNKAGVITLAVRAFAPAAP